MQKPFGPAQAGQDVKKKVLYTVAGKKCSYLEPLVRKPHGRLEVDP